MDDLGIRGSARRQGNAQRIRETCQKNIEGNLKRVPLAKSGKI